MSPDKPKTSPQLRISPNGQLFRPVVILGPWSSGTTACVSVFEQLGYWSCPPHTPTNDPRTPNAREPRFLRNMIMWYFDEVKLERVNDDPAEIVGHLKKLYNNYAVQAGKNWKRGVVMKLPHLCFFVPELYEALDPQFIVMTRDIEEIEKTRERRAWHLALGKWGAEQCQETLVRDLDERKLPYLTVPFESLLADPRAELAKMAYFLGTEFTETEVESACGVLVRR